MNIEGMPLYKPLFMLVNDDGDVDQINQAEDFNIEQPVQKAEEPSSDLEQEDERIEVSEMDDSRANENFELLQM